MEKIKREESNKGITLIGLIVTVVIIAIISSVAIISGMETADDIEFTSFNDELRLIHARVDVIYEQLKSGSKTEADIGGEIYENAKGIMDRTFDTLNETDIKREDYKYYTSESLQKYLEIEDIEQSVLINWNTRDVISVEGIKVDGIRYYRYRGLYKPQPEYQAVEYIQSTGTQYIDIDFKPSNLTRVEVKFMYNQIGGYVYGSRTSSSSSDAHGFIINVNYYVFPQFNGQQTNVEVSPYNKINTEYTLVNSQNGAYINNELIKTYTTSTFTSEHSMFLFGCNQNGTLESRTFNGRIYYCKIWDNDTLVRDLVPCYRMSDNKTGMYDVVNNVFYTSSVEGEFGIGPNVENSIFTQKDITITPTIETNGDIKKVTITAKGSDNKEISDFTLKYKLEGENTWRIADYNYFETSTSGRYLVEVSGIGINAEEKNISVYDSNNYQEVEYIKATGTQWIDTGFIPNQNTRAIVDYQYTKITDGFLFGTRSSSTSNAYTVNIASSGRYVVTSLGNTGNVMYDTPDTHRHIIDKNKNLFYVDGVLELTQTANVFTSPGSLEIFAAYSGTTKGYLPISANLYSFKIYDNDEIVRDYIPCYRKSDKVIGLYDLVNNVFYTNEGTGEFEKGVDI